MKAVSLALLLLACLATANATTQTCEVKLGSHGQKGWMTKLVGNMRPLQCPAGFKPAPKPVLTAFVDEWFTQRAQPQLLAARDYKYGCLLGVEADSVRFTAVNGCIQTFPASVAARKPTVMAQGKVHYRCTGATRTRVIGIDSEGLYVC